MQLVEMAAGPTTFCGEAGPARSTPPATPKLSVRSCVFVLFGIMATVAVVGAKGSLGFQVVPALNWSDAIKKIHSLSRKAQKSKYDKVANFEVDYQKPKTLENALKGCDFLINMMGTEGDFESSKHAVADAAAKADVKFYVSRQDPM
jgi:NAD(P)H-binding